MRVGIDAHMIGDHSGGNESFYTNIINLSAKGLSKGMTAKALNL